MKKLNSKEKDRLFQRAVNVLTCDNPIDIMLLGKLDEVLENMNKDDMSMLLASEYSPEPMKWQDLLKAD